MDALQETTSLISSEMVAGTTVYNTGDEEIGSIHDIMLDKKSGNVAYAVMSFGGFLGMGEKYHPLPWSLLKYDTYKGGYVVNLDKQQLQNAPSYDRGSSFNWTPDYGRKVDSYYGTPSYWM